MKKIKPLDVLITWVFTLLISFVILMMVTMDLETAGVFTLLAGFFSLSYLVIAMIITIWIKDFWQFQIVHLIIASGTAIVVFLVDINFVSWLFWAAWPYFILGSIVQFVWSRRNPKNRDEKEIHEN